MEFPLTTARGYRRRLFTATSAPVKRKPKQSYNTLKIIAPRGGLWYITLLDGFIVARAELVASILRRRRRTALLYFVLGKSFIVKCGEDGRSCGNSGVYRGVLIRAGMHFNPKSAVVYTVCFVLKFRKVMLINQYKINVFPNLNMHLSTYLKRCLVFILNNDSK